MKRLNKTTAFGVALAFVLAAMFAAEGAGAGAATASHGCRRPNWTGWFRESLCIPIRWWRKSWPPPPIPTISRRPPTGPVSTPAFTATTWPRPFPRTSCPGTPASQALLPFPSVLDMMSRDMTWTTQLGNAFMVQQQDVMDAVQRERKRAYDYGYLRTNPQIVVAPGPYIAIAPVNPGALLRAGLRSAGGLRAAAAWLLHRRRYPFRRRDHDRGGVCALGLGPHQLRVGFAFCNYQRASVDAHVGGPQNLCASLRRGAALCTGAPYRAA